MVVYQCARFSNDPKLAHEGAVLKIGKYILATKHRGIQFKPDSSKGIECYVDADFVGARDKADADNPEKVLSRTGFIIFIVDVLYSGAPSYKLKLLCPL